MSITKKEVSISAYKALELKVVKLELKTKQLQTECRKLRKDVKRVSVSRDNWKKKLQTLRYNHNLLKKKFLRQRDRLEPKGHQYPTWLITLVVVLRIYCNCSYGSIVKVLCVLKRDYMFGSSKEERLPCKETCQNWVSKAGYYYLQQTANELVNTEVCLIMDESVRVGTEKLLLVLACPHEKMELGTLSYEDVSVIYLKGSNSWKGEEIAVELKKTLKEKGLKVSYIVSDEGNNLVKAAKLLDYEHLPDISHLIATCLKKTFSKRVDYQDFSKAIGKCQAKLAMGKYSYLRPYKQRVKARFLNQKKVVDWAEIIFDKWDTLDEKAKEKLASLRAHQSIVEELKEAIAMATIISKLLKINGLNNKTTNKALEIVDEKLKMNEPNEISETIKTFLIYLKEYLVTYQNFITKQRWKDKTVHVCSDVIERLFGCYKSKVSDNYFVTATTIGLELPLICLPKEELTANIQVALETVSMTKLKDWRNCQSTDSQSTMRTEFLKK